MKIRERIIDMIDLAIADFRDIYEGDSGWTMLYKVKINNLKHALKADQPRPLRYWKEVAYNAGEALVRGERAIEDFKAIYNLPDEYGEKEIKEIEDGTRGWEMEWEVEISCLKDAYAVGDETAIEYWEGVSERAKEIIATLTLAQKHVAGGNYEAMEECVEDARHMESEWGDSPIINWLSAEIESLLEDSEEE